MVSYHTPPELLRACLDSLLQALKPLYLHGVPELSLCLVDNSESGSLSRDSLQDSIASFRVLGVKVQFLSGHGNPGYGAGHNLALRVSSAEFHLILNPDVELDSAALLRGVSYLLSRQEVVAISPAARYQDGRKQYLCKRYPSVLVFFLRGFAPRWLRGLGVFKDRLASFEMRELPESGPSRPVPIVSGCCILARRQALAEVGGFDERYFLYFEDFDLSLRLQALGELAYLPTMRITHHGGHSARKGLHHIRFFARSGLRFFSTHGWVWW